MSNPAATAAAPAPAPEHRILPNFVAPIDEFAGGHNDDCGPYAILAALHALDPAAYPFDGAHLNAIRQIMIDRGWWIFQNGKSGGCDVQHVVNYLEQVAGYNVQYFSSYGQGGPLVLDAPNDPACLHAVMRGLAGRQAILNEWANGGALSGNEGGIHGHWTCTGGLDSALGYYFANGDEIPYRGPLWNGWPTVLAAQPNAFVVVWAKRSAPPTPPPAPDVKAALADIATADVALAAAKQKLGA